MRNNGWLGNEAVTENPLPANHLRSDLWAVKGFSALAFMWDSKNALF
jgi:hypothetical protein